MQKRTILLVLGAGLLAFAVLLASGVIIWRIAKRTVTQQVFTPQEKTIDLGALVTQVRELNRLETAAMEVMHVGQITQSYKMIPNALTGDEITFLAQGEVIAGIDLSVLKPQDVWKSPDGTINMRLPPARILVSRVDNTKSRVIARKTGVLRRADIDLETRARQHAEANIRSEALRKGILPMAARNAESKMAEFLRTLGAEKVRFVRAREAPLPR